MRGLKELNRAIKQADKETQRIVRNRFKEVGEIIRADGESNFSRIDSRSAAGFKVKALAKGVVVQQSRRKTTGKRGDYGALQMRIGLRPALRDNQVRIIREVREACDDILDIIRKA